MCPGTGFASRAPPPGRALNTAALPPVKCYRCGGPNHVARYSGFINLWICSILISVLGIALLRLVPLSPMVLVETPTRTRLATNVSKKDMWVNISYYVPLFQCQHPTHHQIARDCPENADYIAWCNIHIILVALMRPKGCCMLDRSRSYPSVLSTCSALFIKYCVFLYTCVDGCEFAFSVFMKPWDDNGRWWIKNFIILTVGTFRWHTIYQILRLVHSNARFAVIVSLVCLRAPSRDYVVARIYVALLLKGVFDNEKWISFISRGKSH